MNINEVKENLISVLDNVKYDPNISNPLKKFIESYDGTMISEFFLVMFQYINMLIYVQTLEAKANGYDKFSESNRNFNLSARQIKQDFERVSKGMLPIQPSINKSK